jgi:hypothetical protein
MISVHHASATDALGDLSRFRYEFYQCLTTRADALFELTDAALPRLKVQGVASVCRWGVR